MTPAGLVLKFEPLLSIKAFVSQGDTAFAAGRERAFSGAAALVAGLFLLGALGCSPGSREPAVENDKPLPPVSAALDRTIWPAEDQEIEWQTWSATAFREAADQDRPVLLYLAAPGCEGLFAAASSALRLLVEKRFVGVRVDPFARPDIARRYAAGGWPSLVILLPDGRAFATAVDIPAANVELFLLRLLDAYRQKREIVVAKVAAAERLAERADRFALAVDPVYQRCADTFDAARGGFGQGTKFPETTTLGFLLEYSTRRGEEAAWRMVEQTLDALLASPMNDPRRGGICTFSHTPDWQMPAREKDGRDQAALLRLLLTAAERDRPDYADAARRLLDYIARELFDASRGAFRGRQVGTAADAWWTDPRIYADRHAALMSACVAAARRLPDERAARMARAAGAFLVEHCLDEQGVVHHLCDQDGAWGLLEDQALATGALFDLAASSRVPRFAAAARRAMHFFEDQLFDPEQRAFADRPAALAVDESPQRPIISYRDDPHPAGNALAAELYARLGNRGRARMLLAGKRLAEAPGRGHSGCARIAMRLGTVSK